MVRGEVVNNMSNLRFYRRAAGFSKGEMAEELSISKAMYDLMERGKLYIPAEDQVIITELISERLGEFIDLTEIF